LPKFSDVKPSPTDKTRKRFQTVGAVILVPLIILVFMCFIYAVVWGIMGNSIRNVGTLGSILMGITAVPFAALVIWSIVYTAWEKKARNKEDQNK
jgi:phosphotransferase system  glucose/maltose/N-acetylglucosamine-specific IIC component